MLVKQAINMCAILKKQVFIVKFSCKYTGRSLLFHESLSRYCFIVVYNSLRVLYRTVLAQLLHVVLIRIGMCVLHVLYKFFTVPYCKGGYKHNNR